MRFVIQVSKDASVTIDGEVVGAIDYGLTVLIGVGQEDDKTIADKMIKKMLSLRIFPDESGKTNLNISQANGSLLLVSQFTLYADCKRGNRPGFSYAGSPQLANELYEYIIDECKKAGFDTHTGSFGADMDVKLTNCGPFTIILDSSEL